MDLWKRQVHHGRSIAVAVLDRGRYLIQPRLNLVMPIQETPFSGTDSEYNTDVKKTNDRFPGVDQMWVVIEGKQKMGMSLSSGRRQGYGSTQVSYDGGSKCWICRLHC